MTGHRELVGHRERARVRHDPRFLPRFLDPLRPQGQFPGQSETFGGRAALETALRGGAQPVGESVHGGRQGRCIEHAATLRASPGLLPTGGHSGTVT